MNPDDFVESINLPNLTLNLLSFRPAFPRARGGSTVAAMMITASAARNERWKNPRKVGSAGWKT